MFECKSSRTSLETIQSRNDRFETLFHFYIRARIASRHRKFEHRKDRQAATATPPPRFFIMSVPAQTRVFTTILHNYSHSGPFTFFTSEHSYFDRTVPSAMTDFFFITKYIENTFATRSNTQRAKRRANVTRRFVYVLMYFEFWQRSSVSFYDRTRVGLSFRRSPLFRFVLSFRNRQPWLFLKREKVFEIDQRWNFRIVPMTPNIEIVLFLLDEDSHFSPF